MKTHLVFGTPLAAMLCHMTADAAVSVQPADPAPDVAPSAGSPAPDTDAPAAKKSIVPAKYAGKYKEGGNDAVAQFIHAQSSGKEGFEFTAFFALCRANIGGTLTEDKIAHYEALVAGKANNHGIEGRARMTLGNMLRAKARKDKALKGVDGVETALEVAPAPISGAAAASQESEGKAPETSESASASETTDAVDPEPSADETTE